MVTGRIIAIDHLVLTVASIQRTSAFYETVLGMEVEVFGSQKRVALTFGSQKLNLHEVGNEFEPKAMLAKPGTADLCFLVDDLDAAISRLVDNKVAVIEGPVERTGAHGAIRSIYIRDPDDNLIELSVYERG